MSELEDRVRRAITDTVAIERVAPGMHRVTTWGGTYTVDGRSGACQCPDKEYNLGESEHCKHYLAVRHAMQEHTPTPYDVVESLTERTADTQLVADGGQLQKPEGVDKWTVADAENENAFHFQARADADDKLEAAEQVPGVSPELYPPGKAPEFLHGEDADATADVAEPTPVATDDDPAPGLTEDTTVIEHTPEDEDDDEDAELMDAKQAAQELEDRNVGDDPLEWVPGEFVDTIDGSQAINRKGFEVLSYFYDVDVDPTLEVPPEETDHTYCRVKCTAVTGDDRVVSAFGSAHVDRGDDPELLLEMADTRARKRALSVATGVGAVAVEELKNEVDR